MARPTQSASHYDNPVGQLAWIGEKFVNCELIHIFDPLGQLKNAAGLTY